MKTLSLLSYFIIANIIIFNVHAKPFIDTQLPFAIYHPQVNSEEQIKFLKDPKKKLYQLDVQPNNYSKHHLLLGLSWYDEQKLLENRYTPGTILDIENTDFLLNYKYDFDL